MQCIFFTISNIFAYTIYIISLRNICIINYIRYGNVEAEIYLIVRYNVPSIKFLSQNYLLKEELFQKFNNFK